MTTWGFIPAPPDNATPREIARAIRVIMQGGLNVTGTVTLTAGVTTTTLSDPRIAASSFIGFMPTTANAAGELATLYITDRNAGSCTINHANAATVDRTFVYAILG